MRHVLDRLFPAPRRRKRVKPDELVYAIDDRPPLGVTCAMGAQHAFLALIFTVYSVIAGRSIGLDDAASTAFVSAGIFLLGASTVLQSVRSRVSPGMILVAIPAAGRLPIFVAVTIQYGLGATMGATIVNGLLAIILARLFPRLRPIFPPEVIGVVVLMLGLTLISSGVTRSTGFSQGSGVSGAALAAALACIASIIAVSVWTPVQVRRLAMVIGVLAGTVVTVLTGGLKPGMGQSLLGLAPVAIPVLGLPIPAPELRLVPIALFFVLQVLTTMDQFGCVLSMDKMEDARWRRVDMDLVARAITANGLVQILYGAIGVLPNSVSSANIGLANATGVTSRRVGTAAGLILMAAAFLPPLAGVIAMIPEPVVGGILVYTASYMIVAGMTLIMSRMMNTQRSFTVGLAVVCGVAVMQLPELGRAAPEWSRLIVNSGLTVASIVAVGLNFVLRIGTTQFAVTLLDRAEEGREAVEFLERSGKAWGALQDVVVRAGVAVSETLDALRQAGITGPVKLSASFDEFRLRCSLLHAGRALIVETGPPNLAALLDEDADAHDVTMRQISGALIRRFADHVRSVQRRDEAELILTFDV